MNLSRKDICDKNSSITISSIQRAEDGGYVSNDRIDQILEIYGFSLCIDRAKYFTLESYIKETCSIINSGKPLSEYAILRHKIAEFHNENIQYIFLNEISLICITTLNIYLTSKAEDIDIIDKATYIYPTLKNHHNLYLITSYMLNMYHSYYLSFLEYEPFNYGEVILNDKLFYLDRFYYDVINMNTFELYKKYNSTIDNEKNIYKNFINYFANAFLNISINENEKANIMLSIVKELYSRYKDFIPVRFLYHCFELEATLNYNLKNYEESFKYSYMVYKDYCKIMDFSYLILFRSLEKLDKIETIIEILKEEKHNLKKINKNILSYYENKYLKNTKKLDLQKMIFDLFNYDYNKSYFAFNFFLEELMELCTENGSYYFLYKFIEKNKIDIKEISLLK